MFDRVYLPLHRLGCITVSITMYIKMYNTCVPVFIITCVYCGAVLVCPCTQKDTQLHINAIVYIHCTGIVEMSSET